MHGHFFVLGSRATRAVFGFYGAVLIAYSAIAAMPQLAWAKDAQYDAQVMNPKWVGGLFAQQSSFGFLWGSDGAMKLHRKEAGWRNVVSPVDVDLVDAAIDGAERVIVAVGDGGVIVRSEGGVVRSEQRDSNLKSVTYHARSRAWIAVGEHGTILRSTDAGNSWKALHTGLDVTFQKVYADSQSSDVFVGGDEGVVGLSTDGGQTWSLGKVDMPLPATPVNSFAWCGTRLIATSALGRIAVSDDRGRHWSLTTLGTNAFITGNTWDSRHKTLVLTSHTGHVFLSDDECRSWQLIEAQPAATRNYLSAVRYDPAENTLLAVGYHGTVLRSTDGGYRWAKIDAGLQADIESFVHDVRRRKLILFGDGGLIAESSDAGKHWKTLTPALNLSLREVVSVSDSDVVVASGELGGIVRSEDGGASWQFVNVTYPDMNTPPNLRALVVEPKLSALIAAGPPGTIIRSTDQGRTWSVRHWTPLEANEAFPWSFIDPRRKQVFVLQARGTVYGSSDGGITWKPVAVGANAEPRRQDVDTAAGNRELWTASALPAAATYIAAGQGGAVARSDDAGQSWSQVASNVEDDLFGTFADESTNTFFAVGAHGTLLRSTDYGSSWRKLDTGIEPGLRRMMRDPSTGALIAFGEQGAMLRSEDRGGTWTTAATGTDAELRKGLLELGSGYFIVLGQRGVMLRSADRGKTWNRLSSHTRRSFRGAAINGRNGDIIAVGERIVRFQRRRSL